MSLTKKELLRASSPEVQERVNNILVQRLDKQREQLLKELENRDKEIARLNAEIVTLTNRGDGRK